MPPPRTAENRVNITLRVSGMASAPEIPQNQNRGNDFFRSGPAASKPDSVPPSRRGARRSGHSSEQSTRNLEARLSGAPSEGPPVDSLFDLAPGRACHARVASDAPVGSYPAFSLSPPRRAATCFLWRFPSRRISRRLPPLTDGSPALRSPDFPRPEGRDRSRAGSLRKKKPQRSL